MNNIKDELIDIVNKTLEIFYQEESILLENDSPERNLVFHFSKYFYQLIKNTKYKDYDIDCEYNKFYKNNQVENKRYISKLRENNKKYLAYPDFIFHKRNEKDNLLVIEFKKSNNRNKQSEENDFYKLQYFTNQDNEYKYKLGLFIKFGKTIDEVIIKTFENGNEKS